MKKQKHFTVRNQKGSTMIENLVAMAFLSMIFYMIISGSIQLFKIEGGTSRGVSEYQVVSQLMETIKSDPAVYRKNFVPSGTLDTTLFTTLPYVFRGSYFGQAGANDANACDYLGATACDGRLGYVIIPYENNSGVYMATIKVERAAKPDKPAEDVYYRFIINSN